MLGFLMDCWFAGIALTLVFYIYQAIKDPLYYTSRKMPLSNLAAATLGLGAAFFLFSHFVMSFWLVWTMWE